MSAGVPTPEGGDANAAQELRDRQLDRERTARHEAERLLEEKSRELWEANTALSEAVARLQELSQHDPLTGLSNRRAMDEWLSQRRTQRVREGQLVGVLALDVDHFKDINDSYGHAVGDQVLRALALRVGAHVRGDDLVVRLGGDEILVMLSGVRDAQACVQVGRKICEAVSAPLGVEEATVTPSVSIGAAVMSADGDLEDAVQRADQALYQAKERGRGIVVAAEPS